MLIREINTQRVLSATQITLADYCINPYRGCEFNCLYCYTQENKNIKRDGFEKLLCIKINALQILEKELQTVKPKRVLLGSTTECFQAQELKYRITEQILTTLNKNKIAYTILTKSHLIGQYLDLIKSNPENEIYFTLNLPNNELIRLFESHSSLLEDRLGAIRSLLDQATQTRIHIGPYIPFVSDLKQILELIPKDIRKVDIELYHPKQGNFSAMLMKIEDFYGSKIKGKLVDVYSSPNSYLHFVNDLRDSIITLGKTYNFSFYYIVPDFDKYYNTSIVYESPII